MASHDLNTRSFPGALAPQVLERVNNYANSAELSRAFGLPEPVTYRLPPAYPWREPPSEGTPPPSPQTRRAFMRRCLWVTDAQVLPLAACARLAVLDLGGCHHVTDAALATIATTCPFLRRLWFDHCGTFHDVRCLARLARLESLDLSKTRVHDGVDHLLIMSIASRVEGCLRRRLGEAGVRTDHPAPRWPHAVPRPDDVI